MGELAKEFLRIYVEHRHKVAALEEETVKRIASLIEQLEGGGRSEGAGGSPTPAGSTPVQPIEVLPLAELGVTDDTKIALVKGDITRVPVDVVVNPASRNLQGGGGIEGALFAAGGPELVEECRILGGVERGDAKITNGFNLPAAYVVHTVGPVWKGGDHGEEEILCSCYRKSLQLAADHKVKSIAFPAISTGNFGYPLEEATKVAVREIANFLKEHGAPEKVLLVAFNDEAVQAFKTAMAQQLGS